MFFRQLLHEEKACLSYVIGCSTKGVTAIIDPQDDITQYLIIAKNNHLAITHIIETHVQADHLSGAYELSQATSAPVYYHQSAAISFPHRKLDDGETLIIGNRNINIIHTPGHTDDSMTLYVDDWFAVTGDTLFVGDVGRVDLSLEHNPKETVVKAKKLYKSLFEKLLRLPDYTEIYPGHYGGSSCGKDMDGKPISTIGYEKLFNHALLVKTEKEFIDLMTKNIPTPPKSFKEIKRKNLGIEFKSGKSRIKKQ